MLWAYHKTELNEKGIFDGTSEDTYEISSEVVDAATTVYSVNGKIKEVGNTHFVPAPVYEKALQRYEEALSRPLADW